MKRLFLLSTLLVALCINSGVFAGQSDWDAMWQGSEWSTLSGGRGYNVSQGTQKNRTSQQDDISMQCRESTSGVIYTQDAIIYCPQKEQDLGRWIGN